MFKACKTVQSNAAAAHEVPVHDVAMQHVMLQNTTFDNEVDAQKP